MITVDGVAVETDANTTVQEKTSLASAKRMRANAIAQGTNMMRYLLSALLCCDFSLIIALITQPLNEANSTFEDSEDLERAIIRMTTSSLTAALSLISLIIVLPRLKWNVAHRMILLLVLRTISVILLVAELAYPSPIRTALNATVLGLILAEYLCIIYALVKISRINKHFYVIKDRGATVSGNLKNGDNNVEEFVNLLDDWLLLKAGRKVLHNKYVIGRNSVGVAAGLIFVIVITIFVSEFAKIASSQSTLYSTTVIGDMNSPEEILYYNSTANTLPHNKVLVVVLDGMRYDAANINSDFRNFLESPEVQPHAKIYKVSAQLPSMSVPNWVTILTGAPPESTGVLGNILIPETPFDSIFRQASNYDIQRGLTGSPWFSGIIKSTLPFLGGDGTIATSLGGVGDSSDTADDARGGVLHQALTSPLDYRLFLAHFSDIDIQGHCCGVDTEWNVDNTYYGAVTNKTKILQSLIDYIDNDTVVFMIADHGHVMRGGHGGVDPKLVEVPLIIYKKDSYFANMSFTGPRFEDYIPPEVPFDDKPQVYSNLDVAPTVCAILGVPVPRQNQGRFVDDAMLFVNDYDGKGLTAAYFDLYMQKKNLVEAFAITTSMSEPTDLKVLDSTAGLGAYVSTINDFITLQTVTLRDQVIVTQKVRNILVTFLIILMVTLFYCFLMHATTNCDILCIFSRKAAPMSYINRKACLMSFLCVLLYLSLSIAIYNICFTVVGYQYWDSTVIHTPDVLPRFAFICLVPSTFIIYVLIRGIHTFYSVRPKFSWDKLTTVLNVWLFGKEPTFTDPGLIYLFRYYLMFWTVGTWLALLVIQSTYTFVVTPVFQLKFVTPVLWELRFRVITLQFMCLPLSLASILLVFIGLPVESIKYSSFDPIYMLKIYKDVYRSTGLSEVNPQTLARLSNYVFYSAVWNEFSMKKFLAVKNIDDVALLELKNRVIV